MSPGTRDALESLPLQYCSTRDFILQVGGEQRIAAPSLVMSTRSEWRRTASTWWNRLRMGQHLDATVLRAALHPADIRHADIRDLWLWLFGQLTGREVLTEGELITAVSG